MRPFSCILVFILSASLSAADALAVRPTKVVSAYPAISRLEARIVAPTHLRLSARIPGHLVSLGQTEDGQILRVGAVVASGAVLFQQDTSTQERALVTAKAGVALAQASLKELDAGTRQEVKDQIAAEIAVLDAELVIAKRDQERFERLVEKEGTEPAKRLEEASLHVAVLEARRLGLIARQTEATKGATPETRAVLERRIEHAQAMQHEIVDSIARATVTCPTRALVLGRLEDLGAQLNPGQPVVELLGLDDWECEIRVPERLLPLVSIGATLALIHAVLPEPIIVSVVRLGAQVQAGTLAVYASLPKNLPAALRPGASCEVLLPISGEGATVVDRSALTKRKDQHIIFVEDQGLWKERLVVPGDELSEGRIIRQGLKVGETVATGHVEGITDGDAVKRIR
jgi:hypothetical protein